METATTTFLESTIPTILSTATIAIATVASFIEPPVDGPGDMYSPTDGPLAGPLGPPPPSGECELLGPFALIVQGALGFLALSSLVFKRWRERPQRPIKIWSFDVSKQVVGSVLVHAANLLMSMLSSGKLSVAVTPEIVNNISRMHRRMEDNEENFQPNPCSFYLLNLAIDVSTKGQIAQTLVFRLIYDTDHCWYSDSHNILARLNRTIRHDTSWAPS